VRVTISLVIQLPLSRDVHIDVDVLLDSRKLGWYDYGFAVVVLRQGLCYDSRLVSAMELYRKEGKAYLGFMLSLYSGCLTAYSLVKRVTHGG
jgi:hypothetical protein